MSYHGTHWKFYFIKLFFFLTLRAPLAQGEFIKAFSSSCLKIFLTKEVDSSTGNYTYGVPIAEFWCLAWTSEYLTGKFHNKNKFLVLDQRLSRWERFWWNRFKLVWKYKHTAACAVGGLQTNSFLLFSRPFIMIAARNPKPWNRTVTFC